MALYNVFVPGVHLTEEVATQLIVGGLTGPVLDGSLFQGITGTSAANALVVLEGMLPYNFQAATHTYLQSNETVA